MGQILFKSNYNKNLLDAELCLEEYKKCIIRSNYELRLLPKIVRKKIISDTKEAKIIIKEIFKTISLNCGITRDSVTGNYSGTSNAENKKIMKLNDNKIFDTTKALLNKDGLDLFIFCSNEDYIAWELIRLN